MSVEVIPLVGPNNRNNAVVITSRRKMGRHFVFRWAIIICCIFGLILYFLDYVPFSFAPRWMKPIQIASIPGLGSISAETRTVSPLVSDLEAQIGVRKAVANQANNLFPVDPNAMKKVMFWTNFFFTADPRGELGPRLFEGCPVKQCTAVNSKTVPVTEADALIFHAIDIDTKNLPQRQPNQRFVFFVGEAPPNLYGLIPATPKNYFDMTYTYRLDSDVLGQYMYSVPKETPPKNFAEGKTKLVAWHVSNCKTPSRREDYVQELAKYIPVDIYGKCGPLKCPRTSETACNDALRKDYKFYLSFENSICKDYVTEKFTNSLHNYVVPVMLSGGNMSIFPSHSYIDVDDFSSPKLLAEYLQFLHANDTAYNEYMKWRFDPVQVSSHGKFSAANTNWCQLCEKLHDPSFEAKPYPDARSWFMDGGDCRSVRL